MTSNKITEMQAAIMNYIRQNLPRDKNKAVTGIVRGNKVIIRNQAYSFIPAVDVYFAEGSYVVCLLPDDKTVAVIVGVL